MIKEDVFVTNGSMTRQTLETIQPYLDAANVDLKSFREDSYQKNCKSPSATGFGDHCLHEGA